MLVRKLRAGYTLIELGIVLAILAVLAVLVGPSFGDLMSNNSQRVAFDEFRVAVNYARSEAIRRVGRVTLCESSNGTSCQGAPNKPTRGRFERGYIVFHDRNTEGEGTGKRGVVDIKVPAADSDIVLRYIQPDLRGGAKFSVRDATSATSKVGYISFTNRGIPVLPTPTSDFVFPVAIYYCDTRGRSAATVVRLSAGGAVSSQSAATSTPFRCPV